MWSAWFSLTRSYSSFFMLPFVTWEWWECPLPRIYFLPCGVVSPVGGHPVSRIECFLYKLFYLIPLVFTYKGCRFSAVGPILVLGIISCVWLVLPYFELFLSTFYHLFILWLDHLWSHLLIFPLPVIPLSVRWCVLWLCINLRVVLVACFPCDDIPGCMVPMICLI